MRILRMWSLGIALAVLPLAGGWGQPVTSSAPEPIATSQQPAADLGADTNAPMPDPEAVENSLENAPGQVVSTAKIPSNVNLSAPATEVAKLAQAGVDESVMMAYVTNSQFVFSLSSDDIIYLNDIGVPDTVVTAMMQRDQAVNGASATAVASAPPVYTNQPGAPVPYGTPGMDQAQAPVDVVDTVPPPQDNVSYTYFYDSLAPYGSWVDIEGYGRCWQPTVVVANPGWQPYCDRGHWVYSDCGWYWASDYSWGWAPFHYGRWFHHRRWGWCWAPDTVWGPSWVSWRYSNDYCGWAPLPPFACYSPGIGFTYYGHSVGFSFSFGLSAGHFAFVPTRYFYDRHPYRHRLPSREVTRFYPHTIFVNQVVRGGNDRIINRGIPLSHITAATHTQIHPVRIEHTDRAGVNFWGRRDREGSRTLTAYHPNLPQPDRTRRFVGEGVQGASIRTQPWRGGAASGTPSITANPNSRQSVGRDRRTESVPVFQNQPTASTRNDTRPNTIIRSPGSSGSTRRTEPLILHGPDRGSSANNPAGGGVSSDDNVTTGQTRRDRTRVFGPSGITRDQSSGPALPLDNSRVIQRQQPAASPSRNPFGWRNETAPRQESPRFRQQDPRVTTAPVERRIERSQPAPTFRWPQAAEPREQQPRFNSSPQLMIPRNETRSQPSFQPQPSPPRSAPAWSGPGPSRSGGGGGGSPGDSGSRNSGGSGSRGNSGNSGGGGGHNRNR